MKPNSPPQPLDRQCATCRRWMPPADLSSHACRKPRRKATPEEQAAARAVRIAREEENRTKADRQRERDRQRFAEYQAETPAERARRQHAKRRPTEEAHEYPG